MLRNFFEIRGKLSGKNKLVMEVIGLFLMLLVWHLVSTSGLISQSLLPSPVMVLTSIPTLHFDDALIRNLFYSIKLNTIGYVEAIAFCIPVGFLIGIFPLFNGLFSKHVDALRFVPLTALTGLFIAWFGIEDVMKIQFLAFGIVVYLLPVVAQRIAEVDEVYQQTAFTLGASRWQMIRKVFFPAVLSKISDDIRVLVAISWTYIIIAEMLNKSNGVGALIHTAARQSRIDKVFALLFIIIVVGFLQDMLFKWIDKLLFAHKHVQNERG